MYMKRSRTRRIARGEAETNSYHIHIVTHTQMHTSTEHYSNHYFYLFRLHNFYVIIPFCNRKQAVFIDMNYINDLVVFCWLVQHTLQGIVGAQYIYVRVQNGIDGRMNTCLVCLWVEPRPLFQQQQPLRFVYTPSNRQWPGAFELASR